MVEKINKQEIFTLDIVIPSIRMDVQDMLSMMNLKIPENARVYYYIISDNPSISSTDFTYKGCKVKLVVNANNLGASMSRNVGIDAGSSDYILFLDDDVRPSQDILYSYVSAIKDEPKATGYVGPTIFPDPKNSFTRGIRASCILTFFELPSTAKWMSWGTTSNLLIKRDVIGNTRFSDEYPKHGGGEDIDFCRHVLENRQKRFRTVPSATVHHHWWRNASRSYTRFFRWAFGDSRLPKIFPKSRYYNFPNILETLVFCIPVILFVSLEFRSNMFLIWIGCCFLVEFGMDYGYMKKLHQNTMFSILDSIEATIIRLSNDLGRFTSVIYRHDVRNIMTRFDFLGTGKWIKFERKKAVIKFIGFVTSFPLAYWLGILL